MRYIFEKGRYPNETVVADKEFATDAEAVVYAKTIDADYVWDAPDFRNPSTVYSKKDNVS